MTTTRFPLRTNPASSFLGLGQAAGGDRRALRLEGERLSLWNGSSSVASPSRSAKRPVSSITPAHVGGLPHDVRSARDGRHEIGRRRGRPIAVVVGELGARIDEIGPSLRRGVHDGVVGRAERALRERGERAHLLDLVAEELDAERLAPRRGEHVDDAAAHGELAALVDPVDLLVAGERQLLGKAVDARLVPDPQSQRAWTCLERRQALCEPSRMRRPACSASTSSARYRSPTRCGGGASPESRATPRLGEQRNLVGLGVPRRPLGRVARVRVLGEQDERLPARARRGRPQARAV